ncbi:MAG: PilZ domain-containing protein [Omnitrophica bacterium]|nr:PilZ domain-containing protein [Candidatus Omnitrophota bacterium]
MTQERRQYLRIQTPVAIRIITKGNEVCQTKTKDISPLGLRFENKNDCFEISDILELRIEIPNALSPVHAKAKVVWKRKASPEADSPIDIGCEFTDIEEDNKNTFLKYFCDLLYERGREAGRKGE